MRLASLPLLLLLLTAPCFAQDAPELRLAPIFSDHMVLQQDRPIRVFGSTAPGQKVSVSFRDASASATAGADGRFLAVLPAMKADGRQHELEVKEPDSVTLQDVVLGEVWICSGQSNMEWPVQRSHDAKREIASSDLPHVRLFNVARHIANRFPQETAPGSWQRCRPETVRSFSAVGFAFAKRLAQDVKVPIGLVGTNWGGTRIEPWTPPSGFQGVPGLERYAEGVRRLDPTTPEGRAESMRYLAAMERWIERGMKAAMDDRRLPPQPKPLDPGAFDRATTIYNGMVHPLVPFMARGVIWYQGESNAADGLIYARKKEALVKGWREVFDNPDLSFYWVQLANFKQSLDTPAGGGWGPIREAQRRALAIENTGMAVTIDIGAAGDIHPRNKQDVGRRLARWALRDHYGQDIIPSGPLFDRATVEGSKVRIHFRHVGEGLMSAKKTGLSPALETGEPLRRFAVRDHAGTWHWATAEIQRKTVVVSSDRVNTPTAVRYAYDWNPVGANLYNRAGLAASPFATGTLAVGSSPEWVRYEGGKGPGAGKEVVLISGDEEYRSEEALPQLAKILSQRHGFTCTVLFAIDPDTGVINPDHRHDIPGLEALATADLMVIATRFRDLHDEQMAMIDAYLRSGRPVIGMRTATHAFNIPGKKTYGHYGNGYRGAMKEWHGGFGRLVLGEKWINHHGHHKREGCRGLIAPGAKDHPIARGLTDGAVWGPTDVYGVRLPLPGDSLPIILGQVQEDVGFDKSDRWFGMRPDDPPLPDDHPKNSPMMPVAWTKSYRLPGGEEGKAFTTTMGAATDLEAEGTRRMLVNAAYHLLGLKVPDAANVTIVGEFEPTPYGFGVYRKGMRPSDFSLR